MTSPSSLPPSQPPSSPLRTPSPPVAKRLNRNALIIAAVGMFLLVLVTVVTTQRTRPPAAEPDVAETTSTPQQPSFLDLPLDPTQAPAPEWESHERPPSDDGIPNESPREWEGDIPNAEAYAAPIAMRSPLMTPPTETAYQRALRSPVIPVAQTPAASRDVSDTDPTAMITVPQTIASASAFIAPSDTSARVRITSNVSHSTTSSDGAITAGMDSSVGQLDAGTMIPATLVTAVNSDVAGLLVAIVSQSVYDSRTQRHVIIPQGTKLVGQYETELTGSQQRLVMRWTRMLFPDGNRVALPNWTASDERGAAGVPGEVHHHTGRVFRNALLLSVISAGLQMSQPQQGAVYAPPSPGQVAAGAMGQQFGDVATNLLRKQLDIPPTLTMPAGTPFHVVVQADLVLPPR
jgi:type IV secretory pathway VirB10-like protein